MAHILGGGGWAITRREVSMTRRLSVVVPVVAGLLALHPPAVNAASGNEKVTICHIPPGNPDNRHEITVSIFAVPAHVMLHGDDVGSCDSDPG
jgi:hypothetical protein